MHRSQIRSGRGRAARRPEDAIEALVALLHPVFHARS
jgi:hypothetical protein